MSNNTTHKIILDTVGRVILGELVSETDAVYNLKNPVVLNVVPTQDGKMSVQLFPVFFREFLADKSEAVVFAYSKSLVTPTDISAVDFRLIAQYTQMFNPENVFVPQGTTQQATGNQQAPNEVNLFDSKG